MRTYVGGGWHIVHITDRTLRIEKEDFTYRYFTGANGFVFVRAQPGMSRQEMIEMALRHANRSDEKLALLIAEKMMPTGQQWAAYRRQLRHMKNSVQTGEEPDVIGRKRL